MGELQIRLWKSALSHHVGPRNQAQVVRLPVSLFSHLSGSPSRFLKQGVLLYLKFLDRLHGLALEFSGFAYSLPAGAVVTDTHHHADLGEQNLGPHAFMANTLSTEPFPSSVLV